ncbi:MAG: hypothetical protein ACK5PQ_05135 [Alphaproteobacteria bacterium]
MIFILSFLLSVLSISFISHASPQDVSPDNGFLHPQRTVGMTNDSRQKYRLDCIQYEMEKMSAYFDQFILSRLKKKLDSLKDLYSILAGHNRPPQKEDCEVVFQSIQKAIVDVRKELTKDYSCPESVSVIHKRWLNIVKNLMNIENWIQPEPMHAQ